jgi:3-oxoacyl-(acyl-carrier-protein) synthase
MRRVVITGLGAVTPLGHNLSDFWAGLIEGRRGVGHLTKFDPAGLRNDKAGQVWDWSFDPAAFGLSDAPDDATQFLLTAAREALADAGLLGGAALQPDATGAVLSTNFGGAMAWEAFARSVIFGAKGGRALESAPTDGPAAPPVGEAAFHTALDHLCRVFGLRGPCSLLSIACASGTAAIGQAFDMIRYGRADVMLAGGHDTLAPTPLAGLSILRTMTQDDILPFSKNRSGTLFGEGAGIVVLEEYEHARARGAIVEPPTEVGAGPAGEAPGTEVPGLEPSSEVPGLGHRPLVYCEILGSWQNNNAYHLTAPDPGGKGMTRVLQEALNDACVSPCDIDYINAHGTGTEYHDPEETLAVKTVLGERAYEIGVSSIKGAIAHLMGAAGAVEAIATAKTIQTGIMPPTINDGARDEECDLDYVLGEAREADVRYAASIGAGVGGSNACIVMGALPGDEEGKPRRGVSAVHPEGVPDLSHTDACAGRRKPLVVACVPGYSPTPPPGVSGLTTSPSCAPPTNLERVGGDKVVITGIAPISAIGIGREDFLDGLTAGRQGIRPAERLDGAACGYPELAECLDFVVEDYLESEKTYLDRCSEFALAAVHLALEDAQIDREALEHTRFGLCLGTAYGCLDSLMNMTERVQKKGARFASPLIFTHAFANSPTSLAAIEFRIQGPTATFCVGDVSAAAALQYAFDVLRHGRADLILAGGVDVLSASLLAGIELAPGLVPGEGACLLALERAEVAEARGATILAELAAVEMRVSPSPTAAAPKPWGHTFGAMLGLDLAAAIPALAESPEVIVLGEDPGGQSANVTLRRYCGHSPS